MPLPRLLAQNQLSLFHASAARGLSLIHALQHDVYGRHADLARHAHSDDDAGHAADGAGPDCAERPDGSSSDNH